MGSKKRRKSTAPIEAEEMRKRSAGEQSVGKRRPGGSSAAPLVWTAAGIQAILPAGRALVFVGRGMLALQRGEVDVAGRVVSALTGRVELAADERIGGPLVITVHASNGQVPLASSDEAVFSISRAHAKRCHLGGADGCGTASSTSPAVAPTPAAAFSSAGTGAGRAGLGFDAYLDDDPAAPAVLPTPALWRQSVGELEDSLAVGSSVDAPPPVIVVCGAKKVGKSTYARLLTNSLLNRYPAVAYLDTDCGQPEFTPPGLATLSIVRRPVLGPPHMHMHTPAAAHFVGDLSPSCDPAQYLQHIRSLYGWYVQHASLTAATANPGAGIAGGGAAGQPAPPLPSQPQPGALLPLVVNTHGWVKGLGYDLLVEMLQGLPVTHCVQIASSNPKKNLPPGAFWMPASPAAAPQPQPLCWLLPPAAGAEQQVAAQQQPAASETSARSQGPATSEGGRGKPALNAVEQRSLQWLAFAQQCVANSGPAPARGAEQAEVGDALASALPFEVGLEDVEVQVLHSAVPPSQLARVLNGATVGLCTAADPGTPGGSLPCLGLGIVRAADARCRRLLVLTPVPEAELDRVTVLQVGRLELPAALLQTPSFMSPYLCLFSMSTSGTGSGAIRSRNNLLRASQL